MAGSPGQTKPYSPQLALWIIGLAGSIYIALYSAGIVLHPSDAYVRFQSNWLYQIAPIAALLLTAIPISRSVGRERLGWSLLALVLLTWCMGDWTYTYYDVRFESEPPFPGFADILYYFGYAAFIAAIALLIFPKKRISDGRWIIDALTVLIVAGALSWVYLLHPILDTGGYAPRDAAIAMGYPLLDFVILATLVLALYASGGRLPRRGVLLMASASILVVADGGYTYLITTTGYDSIGNPLDPLWLASYLLMGVCCLLPSEESCEAAPERQSLVGLLLPYAVAAPIVVLAMVNEAIGARSGVLAMAAVAVGVLIVARQVMTLRENLALFRALEREGAARRSLLAQVVTAQEDERHRIALDLHDGPIQSLSFLATRLGSAGKFLQRGEAERAIAILGEVEAAVTKEVQGVRELMMDMRPPSLDERGLDAALGDLATEISRQSELKIEFAGGVGRRIGSATESILYRLAQEAMTNVRKHARASAVDISLALESDAVVLRVCDDGCGFESKSATELAAAGQYGLLGMTERVALLGGRCAWHRRMPHGTEFVAHVPFEEESSVAA